MFALVYWTAFLLRFDFAILRGRHEGLLGNAALGLGHQVHRVPDCGPVRWLVDLRDFQRPDRPGAVFPGGDVLLRRGPVFPRFGLLDPAVRDGHGLPGGHRRARRVARRVAAVSRAVLADPQSQRLPLGPPGGHRPRHGPAGQPDAELSRVALSRARPAGHGRRRRRLAAGADTDPGPPGGRSRSRRRLCREHRAGHGGHPGRFAPAEPDGRLQGIGAGTEDHPSHPGPPGRRPPHPHPRH